MPNCETSAGAHRYRALGNARWLNAPFRDAAVGVSIRQRLQRPLWRRWLDVTGLLIYFGIAVVVLRGTLL
jgi:hypothetical protein